MFDSLVHTVLGFVNQYGYVAVFVYMVLETSFILHFVPSEIVVPFAASQLVHDPVSFVLFDVDATAGATVGSYVAYMLFGRYGERVLERYGYLIHVSERDIERSQAVFLRYGESSVFWARMFPLLRALISIPAGLAEMEMRRFVLYSAGGAALFNTGLTYLVYTGSGTTSPLGVVLNLIRAEIAGDIVYVQLHARFVIILLGLTGLLAAVVWMARDWIRVNPNAAKLVVLHVIRLVGLLIGGIFIIGALLSPQHSFTVITSVWNDPRVWVRLGFSDQLALLLTGLLFGFGGLGIYELGQLLRLSHVRSLFERLSSRFRE
ncbi:DedA family protein [Halocalculus aciditolerans]|uniref:VTT domain-containing protein n=1 Tax=Halocalculus aciditolerans TaxID=1383812 RepID=A0A830FMX3_9EURY|nr:DedA family protein [Halocalculus aciditolerans]GGL71662.1 hypothetical protein GCM10009039_32150 [Halocalculus aciditolerans]